MMEDRVMALVTKYAKLAGVGLLLLVLFFGSFYTVNQGSMAVVTRLGAMVRVTSPGLHMKLPLVESVDRISTRTNQIEWLGGYDADKKHFDDRMESYSFDQQPAHIGLKITWHVKPAPGAVGAIFSQYRDEEGFAQRVLIPRAYEAIKTTFGLFTAAKVIQSRATFNAEAERAFRVAVGDGPEGTSAVTIESVQIQDIAFSEVYEKAIEERMKAEVEVARVAQNVEKERKEAEIKVVQANARAAATLAQARAEAEATRISGEAEASAIRARSAALQTNPSLIQLTLAEKWNGVLPTTMVPGASVPFLGVK